MPALAITGASPRAADTERRIALWLLACCAMVFLMVAIGGITRLTESGLSITQWQPVAGVIPPLDEAQWAAEFERYKAIPQYRAIHAGMTLADFKGIFLWEYVHRLWGRLIGVAFAVPFIWMLARRQIPLRLAPPLAGIFVLGSLQGAIGWYMVASGLEDRIEVSQYRLAIHLAAAVAIYAAMLWVALDLLATRSPHPPAMRVPPSPARGRGLGRGLRHGAGAVLLLTFITMVAGSFVAGTRAGYLDNTFPLMEGRFVPPGYLHLSPWWLNPFETLVAVQFDHRFLAEVTLAAIVALWLVSRRVDLARGARLALDALLALALVQVGLGIATLLFVVPLPLAVLHQAGGLALLTAALVARHRLRTTAPL
ncbi:MAG TPA: COX15/CtaA family protein [Stellaceae bacterium]|nr:COX15/CtaA family protein [Stellaceae bacterium]